MNAGLVLSGGIAKGAYQIGVLQTLRECLPPDFFSHISASSVGVLNAYAYLTDQLEAAEEVWKNQQYTGMLGFVRSFMKGSYLDTLLSSVRARPFTHPCDFYISALCVSFLRLSYINVRDVAPEAMADYLKAGVALPPFRPPIKIGGKRYVDGAMVDNIPVYPMLSHKPDLVIVQYFDREDIAFENEDFSRCVIRLNFEEGKVLHDSFAFDLDSVSRMMDIGRKATENMIREYRLDSFTDIEEVCERIRSKAPVRQTLRITGDMLVNNLNVVAKKLIKYSVSSHETQASDSTKIVVEKAEADPNRKESSDGNDV